MELRFTGRQMKGGLVNESGTAIQAFAESGNQFSGAKGLAQILPAAQYNSLVGLNHGALILAPTAFRKDVALLIVVPNIRGDPLGSPAESLPDAQRRSLIFMQRRIHRD